VGFEQVPVVGLHDPDAWHWSLGEHVTAVPVHAPAWHVSLSAHRLPSLHEVPFGAAVLAHAPVVGLHVLV
jgi:hypothetical protein